MTIYGGRKYCLSSAGHTSPLCYIGSAAAILQDAGEAFELLLAVKSTGAAAFERYSDTSVSTMWAVGLASRPKCMLR